MALRRTKKEAWLENTLPKRLGLEGVLKKRQGWTTHYLRGEGSKAHSKEEAGLENTLPKVIDGLKAH